MVSKKRVNYGFNGYRAPIIPKAPRSLRKRCPRRSSDEDSQLCAFELLAAVAGKLLQESESSVSSNVEVQLGVFGDGDEKGQPADEKDLKTESFDHGSSAESSFIPEISVQEHHLSPSFKKLPQAENVSVLEHASECASSDVLKNVDCDSKIGICEINGNTTCKDEGFTCIGNSFNPKVEGWPQMHSHDDRNLIGNLYMSNNTSTVKDPVEEYVNTNMLIRSDGSVQFPLYRDPIPDALMQKRWNNVKLGFRDDDDNSFGCKKSGTKIRLFRPPPRIGHRRMKKMLTSKYRKIPPKLESYQLYKTREGMKSFYQYRKRIYTWDKCEQAPIKKRKLFDHRYEVAYDQDASSNSISNLPVKGRRIDRSSSTAMLERATGAIDTMKGHKHSKDPHVKFSIKSFKVPELYIEVPETASVGSLKRAVVEAITAILGSGIRVGVVLQGKKVRDDNRTLQQAGISQSSNLDTLGFTLEPCFSHVSPSTTTQKLTSVLPCAADQELPRSPPTPMIDSGISNASIDPSFVTKVEDKVDTSEFISSPQTLSNERTDGAVPDSKALVPVPPTNSESLAVVPVNTKPKRNELSQRRTRRPFSVEEVEALVEAVERLGTGRWRDVKVGAFENTDHRTYVDLKDKWKTLVHTASISPHQRRGETVPQELLDRVLATHSYWSQNQSKQHGKHPAERLQITNSCKEIVRV